MSNGDSLPNDAYGHTVTMMSDGITDVYSVGGSRPYSFPAGTNQNTVYLKIAQQENLLMFNASLTDMINNHYNLETRFRWMALYLEFQNAGTAPNKLIYVTQLLTWGLSISTYTNSYVISIMSQTDPAVVAATTWDFSSYEASDPKLTLLACMQIVG